MDASNLTLYRKRYIPDETIRLDNDEILKYEDNLLITRWDTISAHKDFVGGVSAFFFDNGWKVSKFLDAKGEVCFWYCDIVEIIKNEEENSITCVDLLFDIIVYPNGYFKVVDCDEAADALEQGLITKEQLLKALRSMNELLSLIYNDRFDRLQSVVNSVDKP